MNTMETEAQENIPKRKLEDTTESEADNNGAAADQADTDSKRQKLNHNRSGFKAFAKPLGAAPTTPYAAFTLTRLEPAELPEGEPTTMKELPAVAFNEKIPEELEQFCNLASCDVCGVYHKSDNGNNFSIHVRSDG